MKIRSFAAWLLAALLPVLQVQAQQTDDTWPKQINLDNGGSITIYQPQPEALNGNIITGRAAVSVKNSASSDPVFGAIFFDAAISTDKVNRMADLESITITHSKFPGIGDSARLNQINNTIETEVPKWNMAISLDALIASIRTDNPAYDQSFNNDPPTIYYRDRPTTLVVLDGAPRTTVDKDLNAERVVNSPYLIFKEGNTWNLYIGGIWYKSSSITEGWTPNKSLSSKVRSVDQQLKKQEADQRAQQKDTSTKSKPSPQETAILISTTPAELIQTKGDANYQSISGSNSLLYVANSPNDIFKDINSQKTYILLSGRWFSGPGLNGPWTYVPPDQLPADFAKIPDGSDKDGVLSNVPGTDEAAEARMDAEIPQTAKVDRSTATVTVNYDGSPQFQPIQGTSLSLAENANITVMQDASGNYFALDNGVWFISSSPNGPWSVANDRPKDVDNIPPASPAYNTKYVYIYETTPDYVYEGYTPGYLGSYVYGPTVVYGTGYYYRPWYGTVFYPRPLTWGFGFVYNPWFGWSFNLGFNFGYMDIGWGFGGYPRYWGGGWFGPPMYRPPYRPPYWSGGYYRPGRPGGQPGNRPPGTRPSYNYRPANGNTRPAIYPGNNIYRDQQGVTSRPIDRRPGSGSTTRPALPGAGNPGNTRPGLPGGATTRPALPGNNNQPGQPGGMTRPAIPGNPGSQPGNPGNPGNNTRPALPGNTPQPGQPGSTRPALPGNNSPGQPGNTRPAPQPATRPQARPATQPNNSFTDRDGNVFQRDNNGNWNQRNNSNNGWQPATRTNPSIPNLERDNRARDRGTMRNNNFNQGIPRSAPAARPAAPRPAAPRPAAPSRSAGPRRG